MSLDNYRQSVEGELVAMIFAVAALLITAAGFCWALVFVVRWWVAE